MFINLNIRNKLIVTLLPIIIVSVGSLGIVSYLVASKGIIEGQTSNMAQLVQKTTTEIDMWIADRERDVTLFAANPTFKDACKGNNLEAAQALLNAIFKSSPIYENIILADANGRIFLDSIGGKSIGIVFSQVGKFKINADKALNKEIWVNDVLKSPATGKPVCMVTAPIIEGDKVIGIIGTPVEVNYFSDTFVSQFKIAQTGYIIMLDPNGVVLAHPEKENIMKLNFATDYDWGKKILSIKNGYIEYGFNGVEKVASFGTSTKKGWIVIATAPKNEVLSSLKKIQYFSIIFVIAAIALVSSVLWWSTGNLFHLIKRVSNQLDEASGQITSAAGQISSASQSLAEGASEQAAAIEETSSSIEELSSMTKHNADNAQQANTMMTAAGKIIDEADKSMKELTMSMNEISTASDETAKIIKTIDEIAFQTNLLALNAAVEAARAGEAGAGFAVVADEVRNLAQRAAAAAKNTALLIEGTVKKIGHGSEIVTRTNDAFGKVSVSAEKMGHLVSEIAEASQEQTKGIEQINTAVVEMEQVVQKNAASAEETASASEEMNSQAEMMKGLVTELVIAVEGGCKYGNGLSEEPQQIRKGSDHAIVAKFRPQTAIAYH